MLLCLDSLLTLALCVCVCLCVRASTFPPSICACSICGRCDGGASIAAAHAPAAGRQVAAAHRRSPARYKTRRVPCRHLLCSCSCLFSVTSQASDPPFCFCGVAGTSIDLFRGKSAVKEKEEERVVTRIHKTIKVCVSE